MRARARVYTGPKDPCEGAAQARHRHGQRSPQALVQSFPSPSLARILGPPRKGVVLLKSEKRLSPDHRSGILRLFPAASI